MKYRHLSMAIAAALNKAAFNFPSNRIPNPVYKTPMQSLVFNGTGSSFKQNRRIQLKHGFKARGKH